MMKNLILWILFLTAAIAVAEEVSPFQWNLERHGDSVCAAATVSAGFYLYADQVRITAESDGIPVRWQAPAPVMKAGEKIYPAGLWKWTARVPETRKITVSVEFQGCSENGVCRFPETVRLTGPEQPVSLTGPAGVPDFQVIRKLEGFAGVPETLAFLQGTGGPAAVPVSGIWMCLIALAGGIMLNFTPCVLPLIPVNLAIIGAGSGGGWKRGLLRASCYGAGMAAAYGGLGAAFVLTGTRFGALNASALFNGVIAVVFLVLALAMFGVFELDLSGLSRRVPVPGAERRTMLTAFLLGGTAALLAGACVAPVLIAVIVYAAEIYNDGNPAGLLLPFVLGIGMALPWPAAGAGIAVLPKPGRWMVHVKTAFGVLILIAAGYYGFTAWSLIPGKFAPEQELARLNAALASGRVTVVDFWAPWCGNCRKMEKTTLRDPQVRAALEQVEFVRFRAEKLSDPGVKKILDRCGVRGLPALVMIKGK